MSVRSRLRKALSAFKEADYATAAQECHRVVEADPQSHDAYVLLGKCAYSTQDTPTAEKYYVKATALKPASLPGWQGLLELFENSETEAEKAIPALKQIIAILESEVEQRDDRMLRYQLRLAELFRRLERNSEAEEVLKDALLGLGVDDPQRLKCLCLLADIQLMEYEAAIEKRMLAVSESLSCSFTNREECAHDTLLNRVTGEFAEEALEADHALGSTLNEITAISPPCGPYQKYHDFYLQIFCKAMYTVPASSTDRYNLRLQTLERCYKTIQGRNGEAKGLCTTPFPYITALRLLEINEEIASQTVIPPESKLFSASRKSSEESMVPNMFKSDSSPTLQGSSSPLHSPSASFNTPRKASPFSTKSIRVKLTKKLEPFEGTGHRPTEPPIVRRLSLERRRSLDGRHSSFRFGLQHPSSSPGSPKAIPRVDSGPREMPPVAHATETALPHFMRSSSLSCVRRLHRLDSGFLEKPKQNIGVNSPLATEVADSVGRRLAHMMPWHTESKTQLVLAIRRKDKTLRTRDMSRIDETPTTDLEELECSTTVVSNRARAHLRILQSDVDSGSRMVVPIMALVDLLLQEGEYEQALENCISAIASIELHAKEGGYPRTQACMTFRLQKAAALLKLNRLTEAREQYKALAEGISQGVVSFGALGGCEPVSVRQAAWKGLVNVALAQKDRGTALRLYEQMMGAALMGKSPVEHWVAAEYGFMLYEDGDTVRAKQYLEKALDILDSLPFDEERRVIDADYKTKLAHVYWALGGKWKNERDYACEHLLQASAVEGLHQASAYALLGKYYSDVENNKEQAKACFEKSLELNPDQGRQND